MPTLAAAGIGIEMPCIRCGDCAQACPAGLQPQLLLRELLAGRERAALARGLADCSECGDCDAACPSRIALRPRFAAAKQAARAREGLLASAAAARARYEARGARLQRDAQERAQSDAGLVQSATSTDAVAAAIARAQAKRRPPPGPA
jgi:electron transport complex protein RnfC